MVRLCDARMALLAWRPVAHDTGVERSPSNEGGTPPHARRYETGTLNDSTDWRSAPEWRNAGFNFAGVGAFLETLRNAKDLTTATYAHMLASPTSGEPIRDLAGEAIIEGRHAAWLAVRTGEIALTEPVERILTHEELQAELAELLG